MIQSARHLCNHFQTNQQVDQINLKSFLISKVYTKFCFKILVLTFGDSVKNKTCWHVYSPVKAFKLIKQSLKLQCLVKITWSAVNYKNTSAKTYITHTQHQNVFVNNIIKEKSYTIGVHNLFSPVSYNHFVIPGDLLWEQIPSGNN